MKSAACAGGSYGKRSIPKAQDSGCAGTRHERRQRSANFA